LLLSWATSPGLQWFASSHDRLPHGVPQRGTPSCGDFRRAQKNRRGGTPQVFRHVGLLFSETLGVAEVLSILSSEEFNPSPGRVAVLNHTSPDPLNHTAYASRNKWGQGSGAANDLLVHRPLFQLRSLPVPVRWDVSRRHPYYLLAWERARDHYRRVACANELDLCLRQLAIAHLEAIGVSGEPPDPASAFSELESNQLQPAWLSGAVHPITMRGLAALLITALPADVLGELSDLFLQASSEERLTELPSKQAALNELSMMRVAELDCFLDEPFVSINPAASGRQISEALNELLPKWKAERQLQEQRDRSDKYPEYLSVWDLREGWTGAEYDSLQEKTFTAIGEALRRPISTVENHYLKAFELVTGHHFSRSLWFKLFGPLKYHALFGLAPKAPQVRHPLLDATRRPIPESGIVAPSNEEGDPSPLTGTLAAGPAGDIDRLIHQIRAHVEQGMSDRRIADDLGLNDTCLPAIAAIRNREGLFFETE
jgi:hypothetical protein